MSGASIQDLQGCRGRQTIERVWTPFLISALTTIVGFGSLATSHYAGLISMGMLSILGTLATCLVAIVVIPAWLAWRRQVAARGSAS